MSGVRILTIPEYIEEAFWDVDPEDDQTPADALRECLARPCDVPGCENKAALVKMRENTHFLCAAHRSVNARSLDSGRHGLPPIFPSGFLYRMPGSYGTGKRR